MSTWLAVSRASARRLWARHPRSARHNPQLHPTAGYGRVLVQPRAEAAPAMGCPLAACPGPLRPAKAHRKQVSMFMVRFGLVGVQPAVGWLRFGNGRAAPDHPSKSSLGARTRPVQETCPLSGANTRALPPASQRHSQLQRQTQLLAADTTAAALTTAAAVPSHVGQAASQLMPRIPGSLARNCATASREKLPASSSSSDRSPGTPARVPDEPSSCLTASCSSSPETAGGRGGSGRARAPLRRCR